jgi:hypothetical protein
MAAQDPPRVGDHVKLVGLRMDKYNEMLGVVRKVYPADCKAKVELHNGETFKVKFTNICVGVPCPPPSDSEMNALMGFASDANVEATPKWDGSTDYRKRGEW